MKFSNHQVCVKTASHYHVNIPLSTTILLFRLSEVQSWTWQTQVWTGLDPKCPGPGSDTGGLGPEL